MFNFFKKKGKEINLNLLWGNNDTFIAGPFLGEFGWELMQWQGYIRRLSRFYSKTIVYGRVSSRFLYDDFVTEFREVNEASWDNDAYELKGFDYEGWANQFTDVDLLIADNRCKKLPGLISQEFIPLGKKTKKSFDIIIHARNIDAQNLTENKTMRNWPNQYWDELCDSLKGYSIGSVGLKNLAYSPNNTVDLRGLNGTELCDILASANCCVGPSSGLMHLASLCRTPHIVWTPKKSIKRFGGNSFRYLKGWNPFGTQVKLITEHDWRPPVPVVKKAVTALIDR